MTGSLLQGVGAVAALASIAANGTGVGVGRAPGLLGDVESVLALFKLRPSLLLKLSLRLSTLGFENTVFPLLMTKCQLRRDNCASDNLLI